MGLEKNTEEQILSDLQEIKQSLQELNARSASEQEGKPSTILWDIIKSLLIGVCILGPALAIVLVLFQYIL
ncbi:hypothetical protein [Ornithinibacillus contaminans]|uniref:hypothetical protein n=1 Tax=Ornithinibacillus contaminans TaxID=694055 RepID=UPI0012EE7AEB|nr:hypothetical protein [Ornithinibacillus contaminans]